MQKKFARLFGNTKTMSNPFEPDPNWERVAAELRACRDSHQAAWGSIDNATLGRYLADEVTGPERQEIEEALHNLPELRMLTNLVRDVLTEFEPVPAPVPASVPITLSFAEHVAQPAASMPAKRKSYFGKTFRQRAALAAAACLLLGLGLALQGLNPPAETRYALGSPSASRIELALLDREVEKLQTEGRISEAMDRASQLPLVAKQAHLDEDPRFAYFLNRAGMLYQNQGNLAMAQENYNWAYGICQKSLGEEHPATVQSLANAYQADINQTPPRSRVNVATGHPQMMAKVNYPAARTMDHAKKEKGAARKTEELAGRPILRQNPREVKQAVVPVLVQALQRAETPRERLAYIQALGRLGPVAQEAVPSLTQRLNESQDVAERQAILVAMGEMGPSANNALPVLVESLKCSEPLVREAADQSLRRAYGPEAIATLRIHSVSIDDKHREEIQTALSRIKANHEACVAMRDCDLFSVEAVVESERDLLAMARNNGPVLYITTTTAREGKDTMASDKDVGKLMEIEGVLLALSREGQVILRVPDALQQRGFTLKKQSELRVLLQKQLKGGNFDGALRESIQFVSKLNLRANRPR